MSQPDNKPQAADETTSENEQGRVVIFDTTLRDGEQSPGASMTLEEKLEVAELLDQMGVDVIEAGFPIASDGDFEAVNEIAKMVKSATVCGLSRAADGDIERAGEALKPAERRRIHSFISTSPIHMKYKLQMEPATVLEAVTRSVTKARQYTDDVEWSPEDATRTERDFLCRTVEAAIKAGATTINIPDTVGYCVPEEYAAIFRDLRESVPGADKVVFSAHTHNDLGMAVANALASLGAGVRQIECTINGIGERAGNAALEEIVMALRTRKDRLPYEVGIISERLMRASRLVATATSSPVQYNKAIVGRNAFAHESGIHQHGMLKNAETYEIMQPETVGVKETSLVMGKHSGRHAFRDKLQNLNYKLGDNAFEEAFIRFKSLADQKKHIYDEDIEALVDQGLAQNKAKVKVVSLDVAAGTNGPQKAALTLEIDGVNASAECTGNGPVDAAFNAVHALVPHEARLDLYQVHAVTQGTDAQAEVSVRLEDPSARTISTGRSADPDTLVASVRAYVGALNRMLSKQAKQKPVAMEGI